MQHKTKAHWEARQGGYECARCYRSLHPARYDGEFTHAYTREGHDQMVSVYLTCRCGCINAISIDITDPDGFMNTVECIDRVPDRATKITEPAMAEEKQAT